MEEPQPPWMKTPAGLTPEAAGSEAAGRETGLDLGLEANALTLDDASLIAHIAEAREALHTAKPPPPKQAQLEMACAIAMLTKTLSSSAAEELDSDITSTADETEILARFLRAVSMGRPAAPMFKRLPKEALAFPEVADVLTAAAAALDRQVAKLARVKAASASQLQSFRLSQSMLLKAQADLAAHN